MRILAFLSGLLLAWLISGCSDDVGTIAPSFTSPSSSTGSSPNATAEGGASPTPEPTIAPEPTQAQGENLVEVEKRESAAPVSVTSDEVVITVNRVAVAEYAEFYEKSNAEARRALDSSSETEGAITIGQIQMTIENSATERKTIYPNQGTAVVGNEQVDVALFLSDDLGGEYFPGVVKEGRVFFFLKRIPYTEITSVLYVVGSPFGETYNPAAPDFELTVPVQ